MTRADREKWLVTYHLLAASGAVNVEIINNIFLNTTTPHWIWARWRETKTRNYLLKHMKGSFTANKYGRRYLEECRAFFAKTYCESEAHKYGE
jgi:hypothetical protein